MKKDLVLFVSVEDCLRDTTVADIAVLDLIQQILVIHICGTKDSGQIVDCLLGMLQLLVACMGWVAWIVLLDAFHSLSNAHIVYLGADERHVAICPVKLHLAAEGRPEKVVCRFVINSSRDGRDNPET